jgi:mannose-1-phosphate guanylyltransferase
MGHTFAVIMAGGGGTRLWPISRKDRPKQLLPLIAEESLFQATVKRLDGLFPADHIFVVTVGDQVQLLKNQAPGIPEGNFLVEPFPRGTASVIGLAAAVLHRRDPQAIMAVLPSDHFIRNKDLFHLFIKIAAEVAADDYLVTLGISPSFPATGYGYIQRGEQLPEKYPYPVYTVRRFKEKPDEAAAREMVLTGDHSWNSGMFIWKTSRIMSEMARQMPALKTAVDEISMADGTSLFDTVVENVWQGLANETIDYGIMEHADRVAVLPAGGLEWSDVGSWDSLFDVLIPDKDGNIVFSSHLMALDTHNSLVYGNRDGRLVVTIGVDDLIIVDGGDVLMVCRKDQAQRVRQIVTSLKNSDKEHYT